MGEKKNKPSRMTLYIAIAVRKVKGIEKYISL